jgi:AcrR family transcriptional regulator
MHHACCTYASRVVQIDEELRNATIAVLREQGWQGLTLERVAEAAGRARSTLWRQGMTLDVLVDALVGTLADDFEAAMFPILTAEGTGAERLRRALEALCDLVDRHLHLMLANDEAFHQPPHQGQRPDYLSPFIAFLRQGAVDGTLSPGENVVEAADAVFNATAWPYVHFRGRHGWAAARARRVVVGLVLNGVAHERKETS